MSKKIFLISLIIFLTFLFIPPTYSKTAPPINEVTISPLFSKIKPPVFEATPLLEEFCFGSVCLPPGQTPASMGLNILSNKTTKSLETTTVENKWGTAPTTGTYRVPVLLINFPDKVAPPNYNVAMYYQVFNSSNYLSGEGISAKEYLKHSSYGQLNITFDIYDWRTMPQSYDSYRPTTAAYDLVKDAMVLFGTGSNAIDFTQYDSDNDGWIDGVVLVHAGYPAQDQSGNIATKAVLYKGMTYYSIQGKYFGNTAVVPSRHTDFACNSWKLDFDYPVDCRTSIEDVVHEFAHVLGLPDLYSINYNGQQSGAIYDGFTGHSVMIPSGIDVKKPINFDSWSKFFLGWLSPTVITNASQADIYTITSYDTTNSAYILHNPETMGGKEFFLITNRYISETSLDRYLFGRNTPVSFNINGGIDILHIDENYIDYTYSGPLAFNSIMYDPDGDHYDDNVSHPGIIFEQNVMVGFNPSRSYIDLYTSEVYINPNCNPDLYVGKFDNFARIDPGVNCQVFRDTTSTTYKTLTDSGIRMHAFTPGGEIMRGYLTVTEPLQLFVDIQTPENNSTFGLTDPISFNMTQENKIGNMTCVWQHRKLGTTNFVSFSNICNVVRTPESMNISEGNYLIRLKITDELNRTAIDTVSIQVVTSTSLYNQITSPLGTKSYPYMEPVSFNSAYYNNQGDVTCEWKYGTQVLSNDCNFVATPYNLGLASSFYNNLSIFTSSFKTTSIQPSPLFKTSLKNVSSPDFIPSFLNNFPANLIRTITLTTTDSSGNSFTSSINLNICICLLENNNAALPY